MKRTSLLALVICLCAAAGACAQISDVQQAEFAAQARRSLGLEETVARIKAGKVDARRLAILHAVLGATQEVHIHQQRGANGNTVFLDPSGHREAVYGPDGQLVADGVNDGSYNYFHPTTDAARHFFFDVHPWIIYGHAPSDPTTVRERLSSYMEDLEAGMVRAAKAGKFPAIDIGRLRDGEPETYAIFLAALEASDADELFGAIESQDILGDESRAGLRQKLDQGFWKVYSQ